MNQTEAIQSAITTLLEKAQNASVSELASAVEKASGALKLSTDLDKSRAELRNLGLEESKLRYEIDSAPKRERSESLKEYVSLLAPIFTIITLAATLLVQGWQFSRSEKDKREAAEDAQWADTVKTISQNSKLAPAVIALNPFLKSPKYGDLARATAVQLLANTNDQVLFNDLFGAAFTPVSRNNLEQVLKLDRALSTRERPLDDKSYDAQKDTNDYTKLTPEDKSAMDYNDAAFLRICSQVATALKAAPAAGSPALDLSATYFYDCDLSGVDIAGANIDGVRMIWVDVKGASLADITNFDGSYFYHVAWWEAEKISPTLLQYLENNSDSRYIEKAKYGPRFRTFKPEQYAAALQRLGHQAR
jgi:hypothetical protein